MIFVVLHRPKNPGNLGAVARICKNFGVSSLILVDPRCDVGHEDAQSRAMHAKDVLAGARIEKSLDVLDEFDYVVATTVRRGDEANIKRRAITPRELAQRIPCGARIAILFGSEDHGLSNDALSLAHLTVGIPTANLQSLNLSHAVGIVLYELFATAPLQTSMEPARKEELDVLFSLISEKLCAMDFPQGQMVTTQEQTWRRVLSRAVLSRHEARNIIGFFKNLLGRR